MDQSKSLTKFSVCFFVCFFFFKQKTAYEIGLGIPAEPLSDLMAVNIHITIIELNALHTKRQNLFQELDAVIHLLMEAKHWGLRKSRNATSLNSRFKSLDTLKVKIISRSEERFSRNAETDLVCRLLLEKKKKKIKNKKLLDNKKGKYMYLTE